jgi:hypothetical protein
MNETARHTSKSTIKSLWQEYRIYDDRLEFDTHVATGGISRQLTIPFDQIERIEVSESEIKGLLKGDLHLKNFRPAFILDWANFLEHVLVDKSEGFARRVIFTPEDPRRFKSMLEEALTQFREKHSGSADAGPTRSPD